MLRSPTFPSVFRNPSPKQKMNDHVSFLLQGYAAKWELVRLFQPEGLGLANQLRIGSVVGELIPAIQTGINQTNRLFRANRCERDGTAARDFLFIMPRDWTWWLWLVTAWLLLIGLMGTPEAFLAVLLLSIAQSVLLFARERTFEAFPVQLRFAPTLLLIICLFPPIRWIYWVPAVGTLALVTFGYCLMARALSLLPWNRAEPITIDLLRRTFLSRLNYRTGHIVSLRPAVQPACAPLRHRQSRERIKAERPLTAYTLT